jgi:hypothetical protein
LWSALTKTRSKVSSFSSPNGRNTTTTTNNNNNNSNSNSNNNNNGFGIGIGADRKGRQVYPNGRRRPRMMIMAFDPNCSVQIRPFPLFERASWREGDENLRETTATLSEKGHTTTTTMDDDLWSHVKPTTTTQPHPHHYHHHHHHHHKQQQLYQGLPGSRLF